MEYFGLKKRREHPSIQSEDGFTLWFGLKIGSPKVLVRNMDSYILTHRTIPIEKSWQRGCLFCGNLITPAERVAS